MSDRRKTTTTNRVYIIIVIIFSFFMFVSIISYPTSMNHLHNQVANDMIEQYEIAKRQGDHTQICVQAGLVTAAYLQAKNEQKFRAWKRIEKAECGF